MESKELNLCELLKGCEGEKFYSLHSGDVEYQGINGDGTLLFVKVNIDVSTCVTPEGFGAYGNSDVCLIYPSRALYEKYPLDAYSAWMEWQESRKPKRWRAECYKTYFYITDEGKVWTRQDCRGTTSDNNYNLGNYFHHEKQAQQAAEAVKEVLHKFHGKNTEQ